MPQQPEVSFQHVYRAALERLNRTSEALVLAEATALQLQEKLSEVTRASEVDVEDSASVDTSFRFSD